MWVCKESVTYSSAVELDCPPGIIPCHSWRDTQTHTHVLIHWPGVWCYVYARTSNWAYVTTRLYKKKIASHPCVSWIYLKCVCVCVCVLPVRSQGSWSVLFQAGACCVWRWLRRSAPRTWWRCSEEPSPWHSGPAWQQTHTFSGPARPNYQPPGHFIQQWKAGNSWNSTEGLKRLEI